VVLGGFGCRVVGGGWALVVSAADIEN